MPCFPVLLFKNSPSTCWVVTTPVGTTSLVAPFPGRCRLLRRCPGIWWRSEARDGDPKTHRLAIELKLLLAEKVQKKWQFEISDLKKQLVLFGHVMSHLFGFVVFTVADANLGLKSQLTLSPTWPPKKKTTWKGGSDKTKRSASFSLSAVLYLYAMQFVFNCVSTKTHGDVIGCFGRWTSAPQLLTWNPSLQ